MKKILFLIDTLRGGGAERVLVNLVNHMDTKQYDITVETLFDGGVNQDRLTDNVQYYCRKAPYPRGIGIIFSLFPAEWLYRYFVGKKQYDVIIAYMHGASTKIITGCKNPNMKKITWLHTGNPKSSSFFSFWFSRRKAFEAYASCDAIVGVSKTVIDAFSQYTGIRDKLYVVYNTNETQKIIEESECELDWIPETADPVLCSVGRLVDVKGYDRLISVAARLYSEGYRFQLVIVGNGEVRSKLIQMVENQNAANYIHLIGERQNPYPIIAKADLFVCSSRQEGLSTAVTEAIILGKPIVSTDVSGAKEILGENNEFGFVAENSEDGIYKGIKTFLDNPALREHYAIQAKERAKFFSTEKTVKQVEDLIEEVFRSAN